MDTMAQPDTACALFPWSCLTTLVQSGHWHGVCFACLAQARRDCPCCRSGTSSYGSACPCCSSTPGGFSGGSPQKCFSSIRVHSVQNKKGQELAKHPCGCPEPRHTAHHRNPTASEQGEEGQRVPVAMWCGVLRLGLKHLTWDF